MGTTVYAYADPNHPFMGLYNKNCQQPKHWCKCHKVWLSDADIQKKHCKCKCSDNGVYQCGALMENCYEQNIYFLLRKSRVSKSKHRKSYY